MPCEALRELLRLPGARYCLLADRKTGEIVDEAGRGFVDPAEVVKWGQAAATVLGTAAGDRVDDLMVTTGRTYHLVRLVDAGSDRPLLIYLCLDRPRANLAGARRGLAAVRLTEPPPLPAEMPPAEMRETLPAEHVVRSPTTAIAVPLPRRGDRPSSLVPSPALAPDGPPQAAPSVLAQRWADDPSTLRRLLAGLRALR